jgi:hypothetical protein
MQKKLRRFELEPANVTRIGVALNTGELELVSEG